MRDRVLVSVFEWGPTGYLCAVVLSFNNLVVRIEKHRSLKTKRWRTAEVNWCALGGAKPDVAVAYAALLQDAARVAREMDRCYRDYSAQRFAAHLANMPRGACRFGKFLWLDSSSIT